MPCTPHCTNLAPTGAPRWNPRIECGTSSVTSTKHAPTIHMIEDTSHSNISTSPLGIDVSSRNSAEPTVGLPVIWMSTRVA